MEKYTIYCTPEQTKKALALGAPIDSFGSEGVSRDLVTKATEEGQLDEVEKELNDYHATIIGELAYCMPSAEQMIMWLEELLPLGMDICIQSNLLRHWNYFLGVKNGNQCLNSRPKATIAAIDAALEYLTNNKKVI